MRPAPFPFLSLGEKFLRYKHMLITYKSRIGEVMARPKCQRRIQGKPTAYYFKPRGIPLTAMEEVALGLDEMEAVRLADLERLYHETAAARMRVSRATFGRILDSARQKIAAALVRGHALRLEGREVELPNSRTFVCNACAQRWELPFGTGRPRSCPECKSVNIGRFQDDLRQGQNAGGGYQRRRRQGRSQIKSREPMGQVRTKNPV